MSLNILKKSRLNIMLIVSRYVYVPNKKLGTYVIL